MGLYAEGPEHEWGGRLERYMSGGEAGAPHEWGRPGVAGAPHPTAAAALTASASAAFAAAAAVQGGGSANKTSLYQMTKALLTEQVGGRV